ncbi:hypothetical protein JQX13_26390 [Archangium violaceum]|uniref:hypothetical protein n=1 Tax=Archangium violaceum TaxID=83451 RepID=UPI00193BA48F|nr:hypothetical protein [Archangium violaceum]QRK13248.1 hypothetical protein JQX13_26390 [Archangium violaceum]
MQTNRTTSIELPAPIAACFAHQTTGPDAVARRFADDVLVADECHEHRGRAAITAWNAAATAKYGMSLEMSP